MSLSGESLLKLLRNKFSKVPDYRDPSRITFPLEDILMSAFAIFSLKIPSLLKYEEAVRQDIKGLSNLQTIYGVNQVPSDTRMREVLDELDPTSLRVGFTAIFAKLQRANKLKDFSYMNGKYLLSVDGSGYFDSDSIHCESCQRKVDKKNNSVRYHHQMLVASIVHPEQKTVIPLCPEPLVKQDTKSIKNESERNGMKRFLEDFRREHPKLETILLADALHSTGPLLKQLEEFEISYILSVKPGSHKSLFSALDKWEKQHKVKHTQVSEVIGDKIKKTRTHQFRYANKILFNHSHLDTSTNVVDYVEITEWTSPKGEMKKTIKKFTWITDEKITQDNAMEIMRGGRTRWKIENETLNTLKNQGYEFEHNYGHGYKNLSTVMAYIMMLVFLFDQSQEIACEHFRKALQERFGKRIRLWETLKSAYHWIPEVPGWTMLMRLVYEQDKVLKVELNTS